MKLTQLALTNFRAFDHAEIEFRPDMNLIVGINGVGKSTVLDAIRILLSRCLPKITASRSRPISFEVTDITTGRQYLTAEIKLTLGDLPFVYTTDFAAEDLDGKVLNISSGSEKDALKPDARHLPKYLKTGVEQPIAVYFSTRRSIPTMKAPSVQSSAGGQAAAFADSLRHRELRIREFAYWWLAQEALAKESDNPRPLRHLEVLEDSITRYPETCHALRAVETRIPTLVIDKAGITLDIRQLSDGERGVLTLVLDLARRLSHANPGLDDPLRDGKAVVLIDELDLHLHPRWQRSMPAKLTETFPSCQFIVTTHSPQIIGEVDPAGLILLEEENGRVTVQQEGLQGFGLDSSYILRNLMGTPSRDPSTQTQLNLVEYALEAGDIEGARNLLDNVRALLRGDDDEVARLEASINNIEALTDAVDSEES